VHRWTPLLLSLILLGVLWSHLLPSRIPYIEGLRNKLPGEFSSSPCPLCSTLFPRGLHFSLFSRRSLASNMIEMVLLGRVRPQQLEPLSRPLTCAVYPPIFVGGLSRRTHAAPQKWRPSFGPCKWTWWPPIISDFLSFSIGVCSSFDLAYYGLEVPKASP